MTILRTALVAATLCACVARAASLEVRVRDAAGAPVPDAAVYAVPASGPSDARNPRVVAIEQVEREFVPYMTVVQVGTQVKFPNRDEVRHHVYSFSPAKRFEIKLYAGTPADPIAFDKPGEVVLGCNIHDHMIAYIYVVDSPWFAKTDRDGNARIDGLPGGEYDVNGWYYAQDKSPAAVPVGLRSDEAGSAALSIGRRTMMPRPVAK